MSIGCLLLLGLIENYIFITALFCGYGKPNCSNDFLNDFLKESLFLINEGFTVIIKKMNITLKPFMCNAPSRSFLKCIQGHTGYNLCEKCQVKGFYEENKFYFWVRMLG